MPGHIYSCEPEQCQETLRMPVPSTIIHPSRTWNLHAPNVYDYLELERGYPASVLDQRDGGVPTLGGYVYEHCLEGALESRDESRVKGVHVALGWVGASRY